MIPLDEWVGCGVPHSWCKATLKPKLPRRKELTPPLSFSLLAYTHTRTHAHTRYTHAYTRIPTTLDNWETAGIVDCKLLPLPPGTSGTIDASSSLQLVEATLLGFPASIWEGAFFKVKIVCGSEYDSLPPEITFMPAPFHPNIDIASGRPVLRLTAHPLRAHSEWHKRQTRLEVRPAHSHP